ncbi:peptide/nickel transport system ATP-binding protein [Hollandina sp. SP2]
MERLGAFMRLEATNLGFRYGQGPWIFRNLNVCLESGTITALLGDSGTGKSTLAKLLGGYEKSLEGRVSLDGAAFGARGYRPVQLIFQHPEKAVNPRFKMRDILHEGFTVDETMCAGLGIEPAWLNRYPRELSGGELQRFCIARALGPKTRFIIADEISAMFDPITQAQIWAALIAETSRRSIGILVLTHDRPLAETLCSRFIYMGSS